MLILSIVLSLAALAAASWGLLLVYDARESRKCEEERRAWERQLRAEAKEPRPHHTDHQTLRARERLGDVHTTGEEDPRRP